MTSESEETEEEEPREVDPEVEINDVQIGEQPDVPRQAENTTSGEELPTEDLSASESLEIRFPLFAGYTSEVGVAVEVAKWPKARRT